MLLCTETATLYQPRYDPQTDAQGYARVVIHGVSWYGKAVVKLEEKGLAAADMVKIRIPAGNLPAGIIPKAGDLLLQGEGPEMVRAAELAGKAVKILSVGDNRRGNIPHWAVVGS